MHRTPDPMWSAMTREIIHNLRCALDYLVFQLVILKTGAQPTTNKTQFPIFKSQSGFDSRGISQMLRGVGANAVALIQSLQPFATGEDVRSPLWHLSEFSNWDKHRSIHLTSASMCKVNTSTVMNSAQSQIDAIAVEPGPIEDNAQLFGCTIPQDLNHSWNAPRRWRWRARRRST